MPTIAQHQFVTLINVFEVEPDDVDALIALLREITESTMCHLPGFVSTSVHRGVDGQTVANYAQWASQSEFEAIFRVPAVREHFDQISAIAKSITPHLYAVDYVFPA
jgi:quinol monooxygenase YgiN